MRGVVRLTKMEIHLLITRGFLGVVAVSWGCITELVCLGLGAFWRLVRALIGFFFC